jgi:integrase
LRTANSSEGLYRVTPVGEDVKVVQELLRHGSARITMDVYTQAMTPTKRRAEGKVVAMLQDTEKKSS